MIWYRESCLALDSIELNVKASTSNLLHDQINSYSESTLKLMTAFKAKQEEINECLEELKRIRTWHSEIDPRDDGV